MSYQFLSNTYAMALKTITSQLLAYSSVKYNSLATATLIACFLFLAPSCSPSLKLNQSSGNVQINKKIELRAQAKGFKQKDGPVEINWIVNGERLATGSNFLFTPAELQTYIIRVEALQGAKRVESSINLDAGLFDPRILDLVNGVEKFPLKAEQPLTRKNMVVDTIAETQKKENGGEVRTVWKQVKETYNAATNPEEFVMFDPNASVLWPGALVQGNSIASGIPSIIPIGDTYRLPGRVTLSILSGDGRGTANKFYRNPAMTKSDVTQAMNEILAGYSGGTPGQYAYSKSIVNSSSQIQFDLAMGYAGPVNKIDGKLSVDWSQEKSRVVVKLNQKFFSMAYDDPQGIAGIFEPSIRYNDLSPYCGVGNPLCYISSVTYGRTFVLLYESDMSQLDLAATLDYTYNGVVATGYAAAELKTKFTNQSITVKSFQLGGDPAKGLEASLDPLNPKAIRDFMVEGAKFSKDNPGEIISYTIKYLKDASLVRMNSAMEYTVTQKTPISSDEFVVVPSIVNMSTEEATRRVEKEGLNLKITATQPNCGKVPGTVVSQGKAPGMLVNAGNTVEVTVVKERPRVSAQTINGKGDLKELLPEGSGSAGAWAFANTDVAFSLSGDECTQGTVIVSHDLKGTQQFTLKAGEIKAINQFFGAGLISVKFVSSDNNARLKYRIW